MKKSVFGKIHYNQYNISNQFTKEAMGCLDAPTMNRFNYSTNTVPFSKEELKAANATATDMINHNHNSPIDPFTRWELVLCPTFKASQHMVHYNSTNPVDPFTDEELALARAELPHNVL